MIRAAIDRILELKRPEIIEVENRPYATTSLTPVRGPAVKPVEIHTLTGLVDYLGNAIDDLSHVSMFIHIETPTVVTLNTEVSGHFLGRQCFIRAEHLGDEFPFGSFLSLEMFIIAIQTRFVDEAARAELLKFVGNIVGEKVMTYSDDGISQGVTARKWIASLSEVKVPGRIRLRPFRTFPEAVQPEGSLVFRIGESGDGGLQCALFESDGGRWKIDAIASIKKWMEDQAAIDVPIIA